MNKYEKTQSALNSLHNALSEYRAEFEEAFGDVVLDPDGEDYLLLYPLADLLADIDSLRTESVDFIKKQYEQFREKSMMYLHELRDGIDENDSRRNDPFWEQPWEHVDYLNRENFDHSHVDQSLIRLSNHPLFKEAIYAVSSEQFFSNATACNEPMLALLDQECHKS